MHTSNVPTISRKKGLIRITSRAFSHHTELRTNQFFPHPNIIIVPCSIITTVNSHNISL